MRPRRVAVTLEQCWHEVPGGTATSALRSVEALDRRGDTEVIGVSGWHRRPPQPAFRPAVPVRRLPLGRLAMYEAWHWLRRPSVQVATGPVEVIHATGMAVPPRTAPLVVTVHDLAFLHDPSSFTRRGVDFFHRAIELARRDADLIVCPSRATRDDCAAHGFDADRLRVVPWGVQTPTVRREEVEAVRAAYGLDRPYVLWLGTIEPRKNLPLLLDAFGRVPPDTDLVLAGPSGWGHAGGRGLASALERLEGRVHLTGFVPPERLDPLLAGAAVFCFPSLREGFGMPVLEAMAHGVPVVSSAGTAMAELVAPPGAPAAGLLVDPSDPVDLTGALVQLLGDDEVARVMAETGRRRAGAYTWDRTATGLVEVYDDAIGRDGRASGRVRRTRGPKRSAPDPSAPDPSVSGPAVSGPAVSGPAVSGPAASGSAASGSAASGASSRAPGATIGWNLCWLDPGVVGGSEEYTIGLLDAVLDAVPEDLRFVAFVNRNLLDAYPSVWDRVDTLVAPVGGHHRGARILAESTWMAVRARQLHLAALHHLGGTIPTVRSCPAIVTIHDLQPLELPQHFSRLKRAYLRLVLPQSVRKASQVVTLSAATAASIERHFGVPAGSVALVPSGVEVPEHSPTAAERQAVRARYDIADEPFLLFPGITYPHKNHLTVIEAFDRVAAVHPGVRLVLSGGAGPSEAEVQRRIGRSPARERIRRVGRIPRGDLDTLYWEASALVFPETFAGFGMPVLEAMARGCPVLVADTPALAEVAGDAGVVVAAHDVRAWAEAMTMVVDDPTERRALAERGDRRTAAFGWSTSVATLFGVYRRVAGLHPVVAP